MRISRSDTICRLQAEHLDLLVIGAGITGARVALEGARLGWRVGLVDAGDFGGGTSSASSKLVHGGFRYLPMGDVGLVRESQHERRMLIDHIAPNLVRPMPFLLPVYDGSSRGPATVTAGLVLYRALAGRGGRVGWMAGSATRKLVPELRLDGLRMCGVFDESETIDSRLVLATVKGAAARGVLVLNHARVEGLELRHNHGALLTIDAADAGEFEVRCRHVINAAGPWVDRVRALDDPASQPSVRLSKGVHVLVPLEAEWRAGVAMPVGGGRVALAIPWQGMLMLGTTDTPYEGDPAKARADQDDIRLILDDASRFLPENVLGPDRIRCAIAGLRALPLREGDTASLRRGHVIEVSSSGLVSVAGGKLTTHRQIACDALRHIPDARPIKIVPDSGRLPGTGWSEQARACTSIPPDVGTHLQRLYGDEAADVIAAATQLSDGFERIHPGGPDVWAQVTYAFQCEWACTADDVARRRTTLAVRGLMTPEIAERIAQFAPGAGLRVAVR